MDKIQIDSTGALSVNGTPLPALFDSISIDNAMVLDSSNVEGASGKKSIFNGFDDADIRITVTILEQGQAGRYAAMQTIARAMKKINDGQPVLYKLQVALAGAFDIKQVKFIKLQAEDTKVRDCLKASLTFQEHNPVVAVVQEQQNTRQQTADQGIPEETMQSEIMGSPWA